MLCVFVCVRERDQNRVSAKKQITCQTLVNFSKRGLLEKMGCDFPAGGGGGRIVVFTKKTNLKYLTIKNVYKQKCFCITIKNLN